MSAETQTPGAAAPPDALRTLAQAVAGDSLAQDPELLSDFILESREHLAAIESQSMALEQNPGDAEALHAIFRGFHSIKGLAGFLELGAIQELAHQVEALLDLARNHRLQITPAVIDVVLASADFLRASIDRLPQKPAQPDAALAARIRSLLEGEPPPEEAPPAAADAPAQAAETKAVKVDTAKLDYLADMAGELVIAHSLVLHDPDLAGRSPRLARKVAQLGRITSEIQKTSMSMRLVSVTQLFQRMVRLGRDLSRKVGKPAQVELTGEDTELDRTIVEELADPLMHMVRNAIDHGIEEPEARRAAGKPAVARIGIRAWHQAGYVVIQVSDDGHGLDEARILAKARDRGIPTAGLTQSEIFNLISQPGFSTAEQVTGVSGRGVGMDVVKKQIQKLRGRIEIDSVAGAGAVFTLKVPLTLAMIDGLVVGVGAERYILPTFAVREIFRPPAEAVSTVQNRGEMVLVRGSLLPLLRLYRCLGVKPRSEDPAASLLVVAETEDHCFGLMVDDLIGKQEVVIKGLGGTFRNIPGIAGAAILGDGRVGLILDIDSLYRGRRDD